MALLTDIIPTAPESLDKLRKHFILHTGSRTDFAWDTSRLLGECPSLSKEMADLVKDESFFFWLGAKLKGPHLRQCFSSPQAPSDAQMFSTHKRYTMKAIDLDEIRERVPADQVFSLRSLAVLVHCVDPRMVRPDVALSTNGANNYLPISGDGGRIEFCRLLYDRLGHGPRWMFYPPDAKYGQIPPGNTIVFCNPLP